MRETKTLEFKESLTNSFLKTVSAYANYGSGEVLFGVNDEGDVVGIEDLDGTRLAIENKINDSVSPNPDYYLDVDEDARTITLTVREGPHKPYLYRAKAYRRNDTATVEVDAVEFRRLVLEGENLSFDALPSHKNGLTFNLLASRLKDTIGIAEVTDDTLKTLELERPDGTMCNAAELLADENGFPGIDVVRFGNSISVFLDRETCERVSVLRQYDNALNLYKKYYQYEEVVGSLRVSKEMVPESAFREAVANALVHRAWDVSVRVRVSMHPDRIEVVSPGGLPHGLSEEEYLAGQVSVLRNPILGNVFYRLGLIERFGTGVLRILEAYEGSLRKPTFSVRENSIAVTLPLFDRRAAIEGDEGTIVAALDDDGKSISEIVAQVGFGKTKTQTLLKSLRDKGYVRVTGAGRGTRYHLA